MHKSRRWNVDHRIEALNRTKPFIVKLIIAITSISNLGLKDKYWNWVIDISWHFYLMPLDIVHKETKVKTTTYHGFQGTCTYASLICTCRKKIITSHLWLTLRIYNNICTLNLEKASSMLVFLIYFAKVDGSKVDCFLNWTARFDWYVV